MKKIDEKRIEGDVKIKQLKQKIYSLEK